MKWFSILLLCLIMKPFFIVPLLLNLKVSYLILKIQLVVIAVIYSKQMFLDPSQSLSTFLCTEAATTNTPHLTPICEASAWILPQPSSEILLASQCLLIVPVIACSTNTTTTPILLQERQKCTNLFIYIHEANR